ncbi:hypothetical protein A2334_01960 [Candidatus Roizmanbacteria bacterium RIFOXYB2_FULL_38_10]|uniref:Carbohydrate kinase PfkB domain-containing protein n=1 Tax=Candidatus Roizmanbacteria bacterium RIFOXYD1_FULL_38_12 TaxID=1802093 RepID=A0A1F7L205_9BACT|nr:MAG: hypothetical protein A3K47_05380 [Candidatus Roizmanbacteria bacterium RIFOXYA2_FULL_38_14]OGK64177.1 MAG: hypothetical protein A3K27_05380 [Candidatus Roizmanbacteria bacterium RIFOXYA1_FULL_37_12]OGK66023.1 MAG: hypothetical protein A3K38_05380 [Candidatus Roizmanbacteria bacterium RIFOXYB1_FULL_40_23]OGK67779.1 MAG: hypothetical protein A2334_01960 [Candidatus Roizmanbacteria bacterium RIFOXYB2_FULL_38_10]OGK70427.1 MAG: hypothetical protein A3K21_05385 [Candidatus Roizmanbacteria ba
MNITILGHVCIDRNISENSSYTAPGSPAMFMNKIFKQLPDVEATIVASHGTDFLEHKGNAKLYPYTPQGNKTLIYENKTQGGMRSQKAFNREFAIPVVIDTGLEEILSSSNIVFVAPILPNLSGPYLRKSLSLTAPSTLKVLLPQGYYRNFDAENNVSAREFMESDEVLSLIDIVIVSEQDHPNMQDLARKWAQRHKIIVLVTLGEKGAVAIKENEEIQLPTSSVPEHKIIDSVGSGDIFSAGFAYRYKVTHDIKEAGRFANELAKQCLFYTPHEIKIDYRALL